MSFTILILFVWLIVHLTRAESKKTTGKTQHGERVKYRVLRKRLDLDSRQAISYHKSLYSIINDFIKEHPNSFIDWELFPKIPATQPDTFYLFGAKDLIPSSVSTEGLSDDYLTVIAAVYAAKRNKINDWKVLEYNLRGIEARKNIEAVLERLNYEDIYHNVRELFCDLALNSSNYNSVKWGIIIATIGANPKTFDLLFPLGYHPEFTLYLAWGLEREGNRNPVFLYQLIALSEIATGWGLIPIVRLALSIPVLWDDPSMRRALLINAMRNSDTMRPQLSLMLSNSNWLIAWCNEAKDHPELLVAIVDLLESLVWESEDGSPEILVNQETGIPISEAYLDLLQTAPTSIVVLQSLRTLMLALRSQEISWEGRNELADRAEKLLTESIATEIIEHAIRNNDRRTVALELILEWRMEHLLYLVEEEVQNHRDMLNIEVMGALGTHKQIEYLLQFLPNVEVFLQRTSQLRSSEMTIEEHEQSGIYAAIIRHVGKLGSGRAMQWIRLAANDFHPWMRAAAMYALGTLQRWTLDTEGKELVRDALKDEIELVRQVAEQTAIYHMLHTSIDRAGPSDIPFQQWPSLN